LAFIQYPLFGILKNLHKKTRKNDEKIKQNHPKMLNIRVVLIKNT